VLGVGNRRYKNSTVIGGSGIFDSILQFLRTFTSQTAKESAKHVGKAALEAGKVWRSMLVRNLSIKQCSQRSMQEYTANQKKGSAVAIQDLVKRLNKSGAGLKEI